MTTLDKRIRNPHPEAVLATILYPMSWGDFTAGGPQEFFEQLEPDRRRACEQGAARIVRAWRAHQPGGQR